MHLEDVIDGAVRVAAALVLPRKLADGFGLGDGVDPGHLFCWLVVGGWGTRVG